MACPHYAIVMIPSTDSMPLDRLESKSNTRKNETNLHLSEINRCSNLSFIAIMQRAFNDDKYSSALSITVNSIEEESLFHVY